MDKYIHHILQELEFKLPQLAGSDALVACNEAISELAHYMSDYSLASNEQQILWFKVFKPRFLAHRLFYECLLTGTPSIDVQVDPDFYAYYVSGNTTRDSFYFTGDKPGYDCQVAKILCDAWLKEKENTGKKTKLCH